MLNQPLAGIPDAAKESGHPAHVPRDHDRLGRLRRVAARAAASERDNQQPISIAVPEFSDSSPAGDVNAREITEIVTSDLRASGRLALIESNGLVEENINAVPQFDKWRGINVEALAIGRIVRKPDQRVFVEFRLWDVASGQQLYGAQYLSQSEDWRRIPHAIAQAILERLVGRS